MLGTACWKRKGSIPLELRSEPAEPIKDGTRCCEQRQGVREGVIWGKVCASLTVEVNKH